jgi:succinate-semialdehyde dehydrogenase/glutarate-semialdehyde dehydrogenase
MTSSNLYSTELTAFLNEVLAFANRIQCEKMFPVHNPANGEKIAEIPDCGAEEAIAAIASAKCAFPSWSARTAKERSGVMRRWHKLILDHQHVLGELLTLEQGKPISEAVSEIAFGANFVEWFAEEGKRVYGDIVPTHAPDKRCLVLKQPIGVVGAITPWNFPNGMVTRKASPALAAGCTIVIKPSEDTPLSAVALAMLAEQAGFPNGVLSIVPASRPDVIGAVLTSSSDIQKLSFTGSTRVGKILMRQCADTVKKVSLELGGNAPFIVFDDADIEAAVAGAMATKFRNAGQTCISANRIYVQSSVMEKFSKRFAEAVALLRVGDGIDPATKIGPLINANAVEKVRGLVSDALAKGAKSIHSPPLIELQGNYFPPTILTDVTADMNIAEAEIFGPVAPLFAFESEKEVVEAANETRYGLAAYFWSRDIGRIWRVAEALEYGMVGVNEALSSNEAAPFGGVKESGIGREGSRYGIDEYVEIKYVALGGLG